MLEEQIVINISLGENQQTGKELGDLYKHETKEGLVLDTENSKGNHLERLFMFYRCDLQDLLLPQV